MNEEQYWKNINLNKEMHIAGTFLYDAIFGLEKMKHFCYEDELRKAIDSIIADLEGGDHE